MSSVVIRGGDGNRYPTLVTRAGRLKVDTELEPSGSYVAMHSELALSGVPSEATSSVIECRSYDKMTFLNDVTVTNSGTGPFANFSIEVSPDNINWINFHDILVSGTSVSGITYGATTTDTVGIPNDYTAQYLRTKFAGTNTDVTNSIVINSWLCYKT